MTTDHIYPRWVRFAAGGCSVIAATLILTYLGQPLDESLDQPTWHAGVIALALLALMGTALLVALLDPLDSAAKLAAAALTVPVLCLAAWAVYLRPDHVVLDEAQAVWDRYTHRFPDDRLGSPDVVERFDDDQLTVCAAESPGYQFCLELSLGNQAGREVDGGFRTRYIEEYEGTISYDPYDCFGSTAACAADE